MSDYPMLISNKLHSFRNFPPQRYEKRPAKRNRPGHREERDERIVLEVHSIRPVREMCGNIRL